MTDFQIIIVDLLIRQGLLYLSDVLIVMMVEHVLDFLRGREGERKGGREERREERREGDEGGR